MDRDDILLEAEMAMEKSVDYLAHEFSGVRTGKMADEYSVRIQSNRHTALNEAKKLKGCAGISEDELNDLEKQIQKLTDRFVKSIDDHLKHKEAEIMKV